jgi:DNA polymerase III delta prime subunit
MQKPSLKNKLWVEKYRPTEISDMIFQSKKEKNLFEGFIAKQDIPNLLLAGVQGTGKTTISFILAKALNIHPADIMVVKGSDETGINNMRDNIGRFAETMPLGHMKLVQVEESDFLSQSAQAVLRHIIEDNANNCRFIFTCNYANKIIPAVKSRLDEFHFKIPDQELIFERMIYILDEEKISVETDEEFNTLEKIVAVAYPDIRKTIRILQQCCATGKLVWNLNSEVEADYKVKLIDLLEVNDFSAARKIVCENILREEYDEFYAWLYKNLHRIPRLKDKEEMAIVVIGDYLYKHSLVSHPDINLAAMFITLSQL